MLYCISLYHCLPVALTDGGAGLGAVWELSRHGHAVTILNRGRTEAALPVAVNRLIADRTDDNSVK